MASVVTCTFLLLLLKTFIEHLDLITVTKYWSLAACYSSEVEDGLMEADLSLWKGPGIVPYRSKLITVPELQ